MQFFDVKTSRLVVLSLKEKAFVHTASFFYSQTGLSVNNTKSTKMSWLFFVLSAPEAGNWKIIKPKSKHGPVDACRVVLSSKNNSPSSYHKVIEQQVLFWAVSIKHISSVV